MDIGKVLSGLYASEIPGGIAWVPDGGFDWWVGSIEFENAPARGGEETVEEAAQAMHAAALREYPDSEYARKATSSARELTPEMVDAVQGLLNCMSLIGWRDDLTAIRARAAFGIEEGSGDSWRCGICGAVRSGVEPVQDAECGDSCPEHFKEEA